MSRLLFRIFLITTIIPCVTSLQCRSKRKDGDTEVIIEKDCVACALLIKDDKSYMRCVKDSAPEVYKGFEDIEPEYGSLLTLNKCIRSIKRNPEDGTEIGKIVEVYCNTADKCNVDCDAEMAKIPYEKSKGKKGKDKGKGKGKDKDKDKDKDDKEKASDGNKGGASCLLVLTSVVIALIW